MANETWTKTTSGVVSDCNGPIVGSSADGAGTITIPDSTIIEFEDNFTLRIEEGVTVKMGLGARFRGSLTAGTTGTLEMIGTAAEPVVITSAAASPAVGNWQNIDLRAPDGAAVTVTMEHVILEYSVNVLTDLTHNTANRVVTCTDCTFRRQSQSMIVASTGASNTWDFTRCQFQKIAGDQVSIDDTIRFGGTVAMTFDHCSISLVVANAGTVDIFRGLGTANVNIQDSIVVGTNTGAGNLTMQELGGSSTSINDWNWRSVDQDLSYVAGANDLVKNPGYVNATSYPLNLAPASNSGSNVADSAGGQIGAVAQAAAGVGGFVGGGGGSAWRNNKRARRARSGRRVGRRA